MDRTIAFDTETRKIGLVEEPDSGKIKANRNAAPRMVCLSWHDGEQTGLVARERAIDLFTEWIRDPGTRLIGHNLAFDVCVMIRAAAESRGVDLLGDVFDAYKDKSNDPAGRMYDTQIREQLIDIATQGLDRRGYKLDRLERKHLNRDRSDQKHGEDVWRLRYDELEPYPIEDWPDAAVEYAKADAEGTYEVWKSQRSDRWSQTDQKIAGNNGVVNEFFQEYAAFVLELARVWGFKLDWHKVRELDNHYADQVAELRSELQSLGLIDDTGTKNQAEIRRLYAKGFQQTGADPVLTDTGKVSTSKEARRVLREAGYEDDRFELLTEYNRADKFRSTYLDPMRCAYPFALCPRYKVLANSGRTRSQQPNIQNIPAHPKSDDDRGPELRECFIPRDGNVFAGADYSSLELATLSQVILNLGIDSRLARKLRDGIDPHLWVASNMLGADFDLIREIYADKDHDRYDEVKKERQVAKIANYGYPGGMAASTFIEYAGGQGVKVTPEKAEELRETWFNSFPEMHQYFDYIGGLERPGGSFVVNQHGPQGQISGWRVRHCPSFTSAANTLFQGLAADGAKLAMMQLAEACYTDEDSPLYGFRINAFVHDEFILEGPEERASDAADELARIMCQGMKVFTPDVPIEAEPELSARWDKDAYPKRDEDGDLLVYGRDYT